MLAAREPSYAEKLERQPWRRGYRDPEYHVNRARALNRARKACERCGRSDLKLEVDHVVPLSQGGSNGILNLQVLCRLCHVSKTNYNRKR